MDNRDEVRDFLTTRRERLTPDQAGIPLYGGRRRVKGLRREEVAMLAGMSTDYYTRLERGNLAGVSDSVLEALARALQLDEAERAHLLDLAAAANAPGRASSTGHRRPARTRGVREGVQRILDSISGPAYARNVRGDVLATNQLARALFADIYGQRRYRVQHGPLPVPRSSVAGLLRPVGGRGPRLVAAMRIEAGRNPHDRGLQDLVGELSTRSEEFATLWAAHNVKIHTTATKTLHHPVVGELGSPAKPCSCPETPDWSSSPTPSNRTAPPSTPCTSSPAGAPTRRRRPRRHRSRPTTPNSRADRRPAAALVARLNALADSGAFCLSLSWRVLVAPLDQMFLIPRQRCWSTMMVLPSGSVSTVWAGPVVASHPGLKVRVLPSNIPWNKPMTVDPLVRMITQFSSMVPTVDVKPSYSSKARDAWMSLTDSDTWNPPSSMSRP